MEKTHFYNSLSAYQRYKTHEVLVGNLGIGGTNPIRIQSMTTADTMHTEATIAESIELIKAGAELVRITAPSKKEAENLRQIKEGLNKLGHQTPLVADIHFTPNAALIAADIVEKVRINPGNFADKKKFQTLEYTDQSYREELERIEEKFKPLVLLCKERGRAMRIGTNHGSLSDRIMSRFGDTPEGMVESAMEFLRIARKFDYHNIVLSMKSSNPQVMVHAYRLLVMQMKKEGMNYPLHLGVTEAGDGEDGRIKSAMGIGTLLEDGIGDTIRVSLTEDAVHELPVCKTLVDRYHTREQHAAIPEMPEDHGIEFMAYTRRQTQQVFNLGGEEIPRVVADLSNIKKQSSNAQLLKAIGYTYLPAIDKWGLADMAADFAYLGKMQPAEAWPPQLRSIIDFNGWKDEKIANTYPLLSVDQYLACSGQISEMNFISVEFKDLQGAFVEKISSDPKSILVLSSRNAHRMAEMRRAFAELNVNKLKVPVILRLPAISNDQDADRLYAATDAGALLLDGLGDGIFIESKNIDEVAYDNTTAFGILQASRTRISKTEYIACPSCGRTLFDLQETTARIKAVTSHLKGVKIGIMGCIVNGPGEMADADFGYVGSGPGKITLYRGQEVVKRNIPSETAVEELIALIKDHEMWVEPKAE